MLSMRNKQMYTKSHTLFDIFKNELTLSEKYIYIPNLLKLCFARIICLLTLLERKNK